MNIESELKEILRRSDPPSGFGEKVLERVRADLTGPAKAGPHIRARTLAAAALIAVALGGWGIHVTIRARNEVLTAMRIASQKVAHAQREVRQVSR